MNTRSASRLARVYFVALVVSAGALLPACNRGSDSGDDSANSSQNPASKAKPPAWGSNLELVDCKQVSGWVWDGNRPDTPVKVDVYDGTTLLGTATADLARQDLVDVGKGNGKHGFRFAVPSRLRDGRPHVIKVTVSGSSLQLSNSPKTLTCPEPRETQDATGPDAGSGSR